MGDVVSSLVSRLRSLVPTFTRGRKTAPTVPIPDEFKRYDADGDGVITPEEFEEQFRRQFARPPDRSDWWTFLGRDRDGDACVSAQEYTPP